MFKKIVNKNNKLKLFIIGSGEEKYNLKKIITNLELKNNVELLGYVKNIFPILSKSKCFILSSLWEDPGFIVEAAALNTPIISSDCKNGPYEILTEVKVVILYKTNNEKDFLKKFDEYKNDTKEINFRKNYSKKKYQKFYII